MSIEITMPRLSDTMESGTIIKWHAREGQKVSSGDVIADVETDKATMELPVYDDGLMAKIVVPEGKAVPVGTVIAVLAAEGEAVKEDGGGEREGRGAGQEASGQTPQRAMAKKVESIATPVRQREEEYSKGSAKQTGEREAEGNEESQGELESEGVGGARMRISPVARQLAEEHGVDVGMIRGSGPNGRVIKRDVLAVIGTTRETGAAIPPSARAGAIERANREAGQPAGKKDAGGAMAVRAGIRAPMVEGKRVAMSNMRQVIARRLVESKQTIPHYQVTMSFSMDKLLEFRKELNGQLEEQGVKLSVNDFLVKACALAMHEHETFNASWAGDAIEIHGAVNVGVAIALPSERGGGLVVGTIREADQKSLRVISYETKMLSEKARTRGLSIEEMAGSTFTISNLGMYGVEHFTAIINPPNSAILAVGAAIEKPVVRGGQLTVGHEMQATLSCDHRVIDGATAAQYMQTLKGMIEQPGKLVV